MMSCVQMKFRSLWKSSTWILAKRVKIELNHEEKCVKDYYFWWWFTCIVVLLIEWSSKRCIKIMRGVENDNIAFLKFKLKLNVFIGCIMQSAPAILWPYPETDKKVVVQLWLNIREVLLIRMEWNDYIMTRWLRPSFWVVIHEDWKLWTQIMIDWNDRFLYKVQWGNKFR